MIEDKNPIAMPPPVQAEIHPGGELVLRLSLHNGSGETLLVRPVLDNWLADNGEIFATINPVEPDYIYLGSGAGNATQTVTVKLPLELQPGQVIKSWLRFPGLLEEPLLIILNVKAKIAEKKPREYLVNISFPSRELADHKSSIYYDITTQNAWGLISALNDLDRIPSRWLVAELLVAISQKGEEYTCTPEGLKRLSQLRKTAFFSTVSTVLATAKVPDWISETLSMSGQVLKGDRREQRLLYIWERWLLSLVESDVEAPETAKPIVAPLFVATEFVAKLGTDSDRWLGYFLLGLMSLSPRIASHIEAIATQKIKPLNPATPPPQTIAGCLYHLGTRLPELDLLPARWLVLELLLIFAQKGDDYAKTPPGRMLLDQLRLTRFCKNGVLSLAAASVPRWIAVSQATATAFHNSVGTPASRGGLLKFWEQWLWDIAGSQMPNSQTSAADLVNQLGIDGEAWFLKIVLGISCVSPRIATTLQAIASTAPSVSPTAPTPIPPIKDVLSEPGSLQR
ncbi:hypothetical protein H4N54_01360 [Limnospira fusiformis KN01]|uniref:hypothetical protein n=1 Tax=Limnospira TaxID=2596745 RepID=UPI001658908D|nr:MULTISPECIES: hypothetical protein [Limnospira]MDT9197655.1 hypothetical protein [Limnospira sp. PMC 1042.18]ULB46081.1 hypothetical protein H4N54_01360 [Limnospira fusiformis KN01]